jgi:hypothetical protein
MKTNYRYDANENLAEIIGGLSAAITEAQGWPAWASCRETLGEAIIEALHDEADRRGTSLDEIVASIIEGATTGFRAETHAETMRHIIRSINCKGGMSA